MERHADAAGRWQAQVQAARAELDTWRAAHPTATFTAIEAAVDAQFAPLRAQVVEELALASRAADLQAKHQGAPPRCPTCDARLVRQGQQHRRVQVHGNQTVDLHRDYAVCPACGTGLFPPG